MALVGSLVLLGNGIVLGQTVDSLDTTLLPKQALATTHGIHVKEADLRDVLRGLAEQHGFNLVVDNRIQKRITLRLAGVPALDVVTFLCRRYGLQLTQDGSILHVTMPPEEAPPPPPPLAVSVQDTLLSVDLAGEDVQRVVRTIATQAGVNIVVRPGLQGQVSGQLYRVPVRRGLQTLLQHNGYRVRHREGIWVVDRDRPWDEAGQRSHATWVQVQDSLVSLDVVDAPIADILREVAMQVPLNLVTYDMPEDRITARVTGLTLEEAFNMLFKGLAITYRREGSLYVVGDKSTSGIATTRLFRLQHMRADGVVALLPEAIATQATVEVVKEQNGLLVTGSQDVFVELEQVLLALDHPTPQILIEALVVDFEANGLFELGVSFGRGAEDTESTSPGAYQFGGGEGLSAGLSVEADGPQVSRGLQSLFGIQKIGRLPQDFYVRIHALSQEGKAIIRSRPQVATLNGHAARISIGTTQYYILRTATPYTSPNQFVLQEAERFEKIEASVKLEVTPWVSAAGEVTTEIRPEFSTPVGELNPEVPPTINSRILESTVRLQDGETIILGGLIQEAEDITHNKVPLLGGIPLLGRLFRNRSRQSRKSELVVFLTPHVFYGDARDARKWEHLQDSLSHSPDALLPTDEGGP